MFNSSLTFCLYCIFISIQNIFYELNQCYITPIKQIFMTRIGAWGWFSFAEWLTAQGCFPAPLRLYFVWHLIRLLIFPYQNLRIELIKLDEYSFTETKLALGCPSFSLSLELAIYNGILFPF